MTDQVLLLLVEDEPLLRLASGDTLEEGGFAVAFACDGAQAIGALGNQDPPLAGLITDIRLGSGPDGWEVARRAREINPLLPVVYITGDSAADWPARGVPNSLILQKPFADAQLVAAITSLLNKPAANIADN
ncbi:response regulator [Novosphingobium sp. G106]|uniref:response regulator n=1 Tax=Novosphingobium sp. G106 TaxID=2849500 RepID=UPI001C2DDE6D|nr:response regulator [Novosphingobium sp. G106]MBV1688392.1 response regulator [Novosphingobium sp. G106]